MNQMIEIPVAQILGATDTVLLAQALLDRVSRPGPMKDSATPAIGATWPGQGGIYAGMVRGQNGNPDYHLIVHANDLDASHWKTALQWAKDLYADDHSDFTLPNRPEQAILFGNVPELFRKEYYWSETQHAEYYGYAWCQSFYDGYQFITRKSSQLRARAVRRLTI